MIEIDQIEQEEKENTPIREGNPEALRKLEVALESKIDDLTETEYVPSEREAMKDLPEESEEESEEEPEEEIRLEAEQEETAESEFDQEEEDWTPLRRKGRNYAGSRGAEQSGSSVMEDSKEKSEPEEDEDEDWLLDGSDVNDAEEEKTENDDDDDLLDEEVQYFHSAAYKKRLSPEKREERRAKRVAAFWDFVYIRKRQIRWAAIGLIVLMAAGIVNIAVRNWTYRSWEELVASDREDTISVAYENINGKILKYGVDGAMLVDHNNDMLWTASYEMNAPKFALCGDTFVVYDSKGTSISIFDSTGPMGEVFTDLPIVKVNVSRQGVVAAILEDGQNAWIKSYSKDGTEIATLKTTFTTPGYPMDLGLSPDGALLAVDYLSMEEGIPVSKIAFYNFGTVGQNQKDNLVAENDYRDRIMPEVEYLDAETCVAFSEDGFSVFTGSQIPVEDVKINVEQSIVSTFHDAENIGLVLQNRNSDKEYLICVYNKKGKEILRKETDFRYQSIEMNGGQIVLSSREEFCIYSLQGVEKYRGSLEAPASVFKGFGRNKFIYVSEDVFRIIQVR